MQPENATFRNHLKHAYSVKSGGDLLAVTETSCYRLNKETEWLIRALPEKGTRPEYTRTLAALGLEAPEKILEKLVGIGALKAKPSRTLTGTMRGLLAPKIPLISARFTERVLSPLVPSNAHLRRWLTGLAFFSALGAVWGTAALFGAAQPHGTVHGPVVFLLVVASSLLHELGHSAAAAASGLGYRPIGFSVYLIYPVFYTNVSGVDDASLGDRVLTDCGGFITQFVFVLLLLALGAAGSATTTEAARWISAIALFNMNPLLRTDGYWLYKDVQHEYRDRPWARALHYAYLAAFFVFSIYFLWLVLGRLGGIAAEAMALAEKPAKILTSGYKTILSAYFVLIGLTGGLNRLQEGRRELAELVGRQPERAVSI